MSTFEQQCLSHWGFELPPFENSSDPRFFYESEGHAEALTRLTLITEKRKPLSLVTGEYGSGKSTIWSTVCARLDPNRFITGSVVNPLMDPIDLIREICFVLGWEVPRGTKYDVLHAFNDLLERTAAAGKHCVVSIDEAHLLPDAQAFEEIRLLLNHQPDHRPLLTTVFMGQTELRDRLKSVPQLAQRFEFQWHIPALSQQEVPAYIRHRLRTAGGSEALFTAGAMALIARFAKGNPREINRICDMAVTAGALNEVEQINETLIQEAAKEIY
jgi:type II secretory pathway predicted ATPase ExeA